MPVTDNAADDQEKADIVKQRQVIHDIVKQGVKDNQKPVSPSSGASRKSGLSNGKRAPSVLANPKPAHEIRHPHTRRLSSTATSSDPEDEDEYDDEDEDELSEEDPLCPGETVHYKFVYSNAVTRAMEQVKRWPEKRGKFFKDDVHIFHLPEIVHNCSPRVPFTPVVTRKVRQNVRNLPTPGDVDSIQRSRR